MITESFSIAGDFNGLDPDLSCLEVSMSQNAIDGDLVAISVGSREAGVVDFVFSDPQSVGTLAMLAAIVGDHGLVQARKLKFTEIDAKTDSEIAKGVLFGGATISLSSNARQRMIAIDLERNDPAIVYPIIWNSLDDYGELVTATPADVHALAMAALGTVRFYIDAGSALKVQVRAAITVSEVEAIIV